MKVNLLGVQVLDFSTKDGDIKGVKLHVSYSDSNVDGYKVESKFISDAAMRQLHMSSTDLISVLGSEIDIQTNFSGKITGISF